jgi:hypothetical protein
MATCLVGSKPYCGALSISTLQNSALAELVLRDFALAGATPADWKGRADVLFCSPLRQAMGQRLTLLSFADWVRFVFDHQVGGPQWYFEPGAPFWDGPAELTVDYITTLLEDPLPHISPYTDEQLNQGFWYLVSNGCSDMMFALSDESVRLERRVRCLKSFRTVFGQVFATRCSAHLSHLDEKGARPLNSACYMWWDLFPLGGKPDTASHKIMGNTAVGVMADILALDSLACQESALHGLGHWQSAYPQEVTAIIDRFLERNRALRPELITYAQSARCGCVL